MRKLLISVLPLLAGLALVQTLHAAGMDSGPAPNARPVDPDYESGKKAVEPGTGQTPSTASSGLASRDPEQRRRAELPRLRLAQVRQTSDLAFNALQRSASASTRGTGGAHEYIGEAYLMVNNLPKAEEHLAQLDKAVLFSLARNYRRPEESGRRNKIKSRP